uniref:hypothetical protein n=1 Tax=Endozoicomonas sp. SESOKO2 TaxID=2828743 RepID=UPI0021486925
MMNGAFGLKDREQAWGWVSFDDAGKRRCWAVNGKRYRAGFASLSAWSSAGVDVECNSTMPTAISSASATVSPNTTQVAYTSSKLISDADNTSGPVISIVEGWLTNGCPCNHIACKALILLSVVNFLF